MDTSNNNLIDNFNDISNGNISNTNDNIDISNNSIETIANTTDISSNNTNLSFSIITNKNGTYEKIRFRSVNDMIRNEYAYKENASSTALDILAIYMKGQKILYTEAKTFCEQKLNSLMLPAIFISSLCTVLSMALQEYNWGRVLVSGLNGFNAFLLALISYLKLDAKAEAHKISAYKYDKLQSLCEFNSGKLLFFNIKEEEITKTIDDIETKVKEIKETNQFILPETIRNRYPKLYTTNVFAEVKMVQNKEMVLVNELKNIINTAVNYLNLKQTEDIKNMLMDLEIKQNNKIDQIIKHRDDYLKLDDEFEKEIRKSREDLKKKKCRTTFLST